MTKIERKSFKKREGNSLYEKQASNHLSDAHSEVLPSEKDLNEPEVITIARKKTSADKPESTSEFKEKLIREAKKDELPAADHEDPSAHKIQQEDSLSTAEHTPKKTASQRVKQVILTETDTANEVSAAKEPEYKPGSGRTAADKRQKQPLQRQKPMQTKQADQKYRRETVPPARRKKGHPLLITVIIIILCLIAAYVAGIFLWKDKFLPNTYINSINVGSKSASEAEEMLLPHNTDYSIKELSREETIPLSAFNYKLSFTETMDDLIAAQNRFAWPFAFVGKKEMDNAITISYDSTLLKEQVKALDAFDESKITDPKNACIEKGADGHYELMPEVYGDRLNYDKTLSLVEESISSGAYEIDLTETDCYLQPTIFSDDRKLKEQMDFIQTVGEETITIDLTGAEEVLTPMDLKDFVIVDADKNITVNEDKLTSYVNELADKYNTYLNEREFTDHNGNVRTVGGNHTKDYGIDTYGFLMNRAVTTNILRECILSREDQTMTPSWDVPALTRNDVNDDIGETYIEISLEEQHLWYFVNGELTFEADVVTGLDTDERRTPWGVFRAYEKDKDCTLKGEMAGERWNTKVGFWISVTWTGVGIHDATWQPMFGGDWYKSGGSHGCINVSYETAEYLYNNLGIDTPIVIY